MCTIFQQKRFLTCTLFLLNSALFLRCNATSNGRLIPEFDRTPGGLWAGHSNSPRDQGSSLIIPMGCGGTVKLPAVGQFALLEYKSTEAYDNNEKCVWTLDTTDGNVRRTLILKATLEVDGFQGKDSVSILSVSRWSNLVSHTLKSAVTVESDAEWHFLTFVSDSATTGTGFIVRVEVVANKLSFVGHIIPPPTVFTAGSYSKVSGEKLQQVLAVISPQEREITFTIDSIDIDMGEGSTASNLQVYAMDSSGNFNRRAQLFGNFKSSPASFQTKFPIISLYAVHGRTLDVAYAMSFKVSWD